MSKKAKLLTGMLSVAAVLDICHCAGGGIYGCCRTLQHDNDGILQGMGGQTVEAVKAGI